MAMTCVLTATSCWADSVLKAFVEKPDPTTHWEIVGSATEEGVTVYNILLTSQTWRDIPWKHHLALVVPEKKKDTKHALLFISGGSLDENGNPRIKNKSDEIARIGKIATLTGSPVAVLGQVPNQPLYGGKKEDDLISYTYDQYVKTGDNTWPLLQPMVKSAARAMDAVQDVAKTKAGVTVEKFVVSGASKRGWTTWLTGAVEPRVAAIAPMVIDTLYFEKQMPHQLESWGKYSEQIEDYTRLGLQEKLASDEGKSLRQIVDPYSFVDSLTMPKLLFMGTNDPYWVVDAVKFYYDDLKGDKGIHYVANAGHGLKDGKEAIENLAAFFATIATGRKDPILNWKTNVENGKVTVNLTANVDAVSGKLWTATQSDRDFRDATWTSQGLDSDDSRAATVSVPLPKEGFKTFYVEAFFPSPLGGDWSKCTRVFVLDKNGIL